ncbi:MAG: ornithine carbamoyltransferase [Deltaproteobacteria bacterium]|nr:ornithine carbamoyltransferase [Candidatus Zymogenaceae bacterium]
MLDHFLRISHLTADEGREILDRGRDLKIRQLNDIRYTPMAGKTLAMIFEKPSTRTRVSFETGIYQLGGQGIYLSSQDIQLSRGESVGDTARTLSGYVDMVMIRAFSQDMVEELAEYSSVPVINGLTDLLHPCQVMSDVFTVMEVTGKDLKDVEMVYIGDGNNLANSWIHAAGLFGFRLTLACPKELAPDDEIFKKGKKILEERLNLTTDPREAVGEADVIYTDTWVSMGEDEQRQKKIKLLKGFQVNDDLLEAAPDHVKVMHCLPAHRGEEITDSVMDGKQSVVFLQAHNRLHVQKAIMDILNQRREEAK